MSELATRYDRHYRDYLNPTRGLTIQHAASLVESYARGEFADLMWTFGAPFTGIECSDADLLALIERRISAIQRIEWNVYVVDRDGIDQALAEEQQAYIRELMDGIKGLYKSIAHLVLASFRGFAHLEQIAERGTLRELRCIPQWNVVRDGSTGAWRYNPAAHQTSYSSLGPEMDIDPSRWVIRTVDRPIGRIALIKYVRQNLTDKDWSAFVEIFGLPGGVVIGPPDVPESKEQEYAAAAENIANGGRGYLPHGASWVPYVLPKANMPFKEYLDHLTEKLVLAGTGGKLTMLTESGSGTLAGGAHSDTFKELAEAEAQLISEIIQDQVIYPRLQAQFGKLSRRGNLVERVPELAYWKLAANEETDTSTIVDDVLKLSQAGFGMSAEQLAERTGYQVATQRNELSDQPLTELGDSQPLAAQIGVGGVQGLIEIATAVGSGSFSRTEGIEMLIRVFGLDRESAEKIIPTNADNPPDANALQIDRNGLQTNRRPFTSPLTQIGDQPASQGLSSTLRNRGALATQVGRLLTRIELGDNAAIDEALALIDSLGPEAIADVGSLVSALERAAMEAAVLGAMGKTAAQAAKS